jgi:hypothetical protein
VAVPTHLNSSSLPSLLSKDSDVDKEREKEKEKEQEKAREAEKEREKRLEELAKELEKEKEARVKALSEKAALEAEIESLSQALFEEVCTLPFLSHFYLFFAFHIIFVIRHLYLYSYSIQHNANHAPSPLRPHRQTKWLLKNA